MIFVNDQKRAGRLVQKCTEWLIVYGLGLSIYRAIVVNKNTETTEYTKKIQHKEHKDIG